MTGDIPAPEEVQGQTPGEERRGAPLSNKSARRLVWATLCFMILMAILDVTRAVSSSVYYFSLSVSGIAWGLIGGLQCGGRTTRSKRKRLAWLVVAIAWAAWGVRFAVSALV